MESVRNVVSWTDLTPPFDNTFEVLRTHCECSAEHLLALKLAKGPALDSVGAVIAQDHLRHLPICSSWPAKALASLRDNLIAHIYQASSLSTDDPSRHWHCLQGEDSSNPQLRAKKVMVEDIANVISENRAHFLQMVSVDSRLNEHLEETLLLYLTRSFNEDSFAKLDQAGEDQDDTPLRQVFVDLELKLLRSNPSSKHNKQSQLSLFDIEEIAPETLKILRLAGQEKELSAMDCLLQEIAPKVVIIGGPGQGKSTLGQYLAQVHRAVYLHCEEKLYRDIPGQRTKQKSFKPKTLRIPFRIVLKYFAQWLNDGPAIASIEAYLAEQIGKVASRPGKVSPSDIQEIIKRRPVLVIFDGLDEVTKPELRIHMLRCLEQFLDSAEILHANLQILATSRPTGYNGQFNPHEYWHFELQPMSTKKVQIYATNWIEVKLSLEEEQRRVQDTLQECLHEEHTRLLLTTPLQVTIVLLIIKNGGRPSAQRETLFHQYWDTILRREKAKFKEIIRTDDTTLFNLHAHMGYILHHKAESENVQALLSEHDFSKLIYDFLRKDDIYSQEEIIKQRAEQMVEEAKDRLVMLVEPETGFFGFELRSLQEFFASAYLAQTASDTQQRFVRFRAMAHSEHWHNVALFFAGRIVRNYGGESEKILIDGCQPIDREEPDHYLRRGAWLALDIAADGIFANNRNLQYSVLEYGLNILDKIITNDEQKKLISTLHRLSTEDRRDMLGKILKRKLISSPLPYQVGLLGIYGQFVRLQPDFIQGLENLLTSDITMYIQQALDLAFQYQADPQWLARQLEKHWTRWMTSNDTYTNPLLEWWQKKRQYTQAVLSILSMSKDQIDLLTVGLSQPSIRIMDSQKDSQFELLENPQTLSDQIIILLQCTSNANYISENSHIYYSKQKGYFYLFGIKQSNKLKDLLIHSGLLEKINKLMERKDLILPLRICIWALYWLTNELNEVKAATFLEESKTWNTKDVLPRLFWDFGLHRAHPLLKLALENQSRNDKKNGTKLLSFLNSSQEIAIGKQIQAAIEKRVQSYSQEKQSRFILEFYNDIANNLPEILPLAKKLGIDANDLVLTYGYPYYTMGNRQSYSTKLLQHAFSVIEEIINQPQKVQEIVIRLRHDQWSIDQETFSKGRRLLQTIIERLPAQSDLLDTAIFFFLKLLAFDVTILSLAPTLLIALTSIRETGMPSTWMVSNTADISLEYLTNLANFTQHEETRVQQGALILWEALIEGLSNRIRGETIDFSKFKVVGIDWRLSFALLNATDIVTRKRGIILLTLSNFPMAEKCHRNELNSSNGKSTGHKGIRSLDFLLTTCSYGVAANCMASYVRRNIRLPTTLYF